MRKLIAILGPSAALVSLASPATAAPDQTGQLAVKPLLDGRARFETVEQGPLDADALTLRLRGGAVAGLGRFTLLAEGEGTVALDSSYNAFPFPMPGERQWRPGYAVIADPENLELNRLQLQYKAEKNAITVGRQRINLDDQRWVGSVGWRQNEQTFDAVRGELQLGPVTADLAYAVSQRTIFGEDAGPRRAYDGHFVFAGLGSKIGPVHAKLFSYLLDYDESFFLANSSQTFGGIVSGAVPLGGTTQLSLRGSYACQSDYKDNPFDYSAKYWNLEAGVTVAGFAFLGGWEKLGSNNGRAVQTPMATLHKFNGWADLFLITPAAGLEDAYVSLSRKFDGVKVLPGLNANLTFHQFDSAKGDLEYGTEWDASLGFKLGKVGLLLKYANYNAREFGADTRKLWLQAEWAL